MRSPGWPLRRPSWPGPDVFDPAGFLPDDRLSRDGAFVPQGGVDVRSGHRCPGKPIAVDLFAHTLRRLSRLPARLPDQDLTISTRRMPTRPAGGVCLALGQGRAG